MFNVTGSEIVIVLLLALVVLGPEKLPDAVRRFAKTYAELKKVGTGFQQEFKAAMDEPLREMRETADLLRTSADFGAMVDPTRAAGETATTTAPGTPTASETTAAAGASGPAESVEPAASVEPVESREPVVSVESAEPAAPVEPPERPKQIWSAAPPYRRAATPADDVAVDPATSEATGAVTGEAASALTDTDGVEDRSA